MCVLGISTIYPVIEEKLQQINDAFSWLAKPIMAPTYSVLDLLFFRNVRMPCTVIVLGFSFPPTHVPVFFTSGQTRETD